MPDYLDGMSTIYFASSLVFLNRFFFFLPIRFDSLFVCMFLFIVIFFGIIVSWGRVLTVGDVCVCGGGRLVTFLMRPILDSSFINIISFVDKG